MKRLLSRDPETGIETWFHDEPNIDGMSIQRYQDCDPILENLKKFREEGNYKGGEMWYAGSIPMVVYEQWAREAGVDVNDHHAMTEICKRKLNDGNWHKLRGGDFRI